MLTVLTNTIYAFFSTLGFAVLFNIPRKELILAGLTGAMGWFAFQLVSISLSSNIIASFFGGLTAALTGEILARIKKQPATLFVVPGIIPLVPGYGLYYTMLKIIQQDYSEAVSVGFEALLVAISIASAIIIATTIGRVLKEWLTVN
jgi:uncharacterized membrane protein YjjB (DUF3815 family)